MAITMYQSDRNFVTPANDASLYSALGGDTSGVISRGNNLKVTINGLVATVDTGQVIVLGRLVEVVTPTQITLPANSQGQLCIVVDLSKTNDVTGNAGDSGYTVNVKQVYLSVVTGSLTQDDINNGGFIYELPIGTFTSNSTTATFAQKNPILRDTGWKDMPLADNAKFNPNSNKYARYRVLNGIVTIMFDGVDATSTSRKGELFKLPSEIVPNITDFQAMLFQINNFDDYTTDVYPVTAVLDTRHIYARWNTHWFGVGSLTHASGTIIYSLG